MLAVAAFVEYLGNVLHGAEQTWRADACPDSVLEEDGQRQERDMDMGK